MTNFYRARAFCVTLLALASVCHPAQAADENPYADTLLGTWGGLRPTLSDAGVDVSVEYKADLWRNASGGRKKGNAYLDNLDVKFDLDGEKLFGIAGNKSLVYFINNNGSHPNASQVGSVQGIDNLEVGTDTAKLYELWTEQSFLGDRLAVLVGLHDLNSEFMVNDMTSNFIKPVFQVGQEFAQTGKNGPSIFPNTSLAGRVRVAPTHESYVMAALFDGVPGDPARPHGTHQTLKSDDGLLMIAEAGFTPAAVNQGDDVPNKFALGAWSYTKQADDLVEVDAAGNPVKHRSEGVYLLSSYQFYHDASDRTLGAFMRAGSGDGDSGQVDWFYATGFVANGWMPTRPDSEIGLGFTQSHNGDTYMQSVAASGGQSDRNEYGVDLYYRDVIAPGLSVQPNLQYVANPSTDPTLKNATILGMRFDVTF